MAEIDIRKLAAQLDAAQVILDQIRVTSGCSLFGPARPATAERIETALATARKAFDDRRARAAYIGSEEIFGEPAWDILLDLFIRQATEQEDGSKALARTNPTASTKSKRPVKTVASYGRFRENGREVGMTGGGWLGERRLCGFFGGDHLLVNQTFISPGYSH